MGAYTDNLLRRKRAAKIEMKQKEKVMRSQEHLVSCAIKRDGALYTGGFHAHWEIRYNLLGDESPQKGQPGDEEGYLTSEGRFVDRYEGADICSLAGQGRPTGMSGLLSCDVDKWDKWEPLA